MKSSSYLELVDEIINLVNSGKQKEALELLRQNAEKKDKDAITALASFYLYGWGVTRDIEKAIELFEKGICLGSADAALELAFIYYKNEEGIPINKPLAVELFEKGAKAGHEACCAALSTIYLNGDGVPANGEKAFLYAMTAAKAGNFIAMLNVAVCYEDGIGVKQDPYQACYWYKQYLNYEEREDFVLLRIALCLADPYERFHIRPTNEMLREAFSYANKAMEKGDIEAYLIVGWFYEKGEVVRQDFELAHRYIKIAADNGNEIAKEHIKIFKKNIFGKYYIS